MTDTSRRLKVIQAVAAEHVVEGSISLRCRCLRVLQLLGNFSGATPSLLRSILGHPPRSLSLAALPLVRRAEVCGDK